MTIFLHNNPARRRLYYAFFLLLALFASPDFVRAAEPVQIVVEGVAGSERINVLEELVLPFGLVKDGKVDRLWLRRFVRQADQKVIAALEPFGYYAPVVAIDLETIATDQYRLLVKIEKGDPALLTDVQVSLSGPGKTESRLTELVENFPLQKGSILLHQPYEQAKRNLETRAKELGYLDADFPVHEILVAQDGKSARINLVLQTGNKYYFAQIDLEGAPSYPDTFLRRYLTVLPNEPFSYNKLAESQLQLNNSERFKEVKILAEKDRAIDYKIPVRFELQPAPRKSLRPGVGYGTDTGARFSLRYRDLNMLQKGHQLDSNLYISERLQGLSTSYIFPGAKDIRSFTSAQINIQKDDISTYKSRLVSLELAKTSSLGKTRQGTAYVKLQHEEFTIGLQDSTSRYVLPGIRFSDTRYDSVVRPEKGFRYALDLRGTHQALGSTTQLLQLISEASHLVSLPWRLSLATSAKAGVTFFSDTLDDLPPSLRFFAGGDQSVRGYAYQSLGPVDSLGNVVGGKHLLSGCVEMKRALMEDWAVSAFYNAGNAFDSFKELKLFQAAGAGVHYYTPVGALNLYLARQIGEDEPKFRIHFTVGFEF
jgi:translocation and assembly module TamA